jgi:hypothetical protein
MITISKRVAAAAASGAKKARSAAVKQPMSAKRASELGLYFATKGKRENEKKTEMPLPRHVHSFFALSQDRYCALAFGVGAVLGMHCIALHYIALHCIAFFRLLLLFVVCRISTLSTCRAFILTVALAKITLTLCVRARKQTHDRYANRIAQSLYSIAQR